MIKEGSRSYTYGYLDKVTSVKDGANVYTYDYHVDKISKDDVRRRFK